MDYEEHDEGDDEMGISSEYVDQLGNSSANLASPAGAGSFRAKTGDGMGGSHHHYQGSGVRAGRKGGITSTNHAGTRYRECLKNHAVGLGGHTLDGCGEFMPAGEDGTLNALKCAACNCHRNFHRKETEESGAAAAAFMHPHSGSEATFSPYYYRTPAGYLHMTRPQLLALPSTSGGAGAHSRGDDQDDISNPSSCGGPPHSQPKSKRFRTKFTQEQKDKMLAFAERVGWRIQKQDEAAVLQFCEQTAVKRHVLKVWMHKNKYTLGKKP